VRARLRLDIAVTSQASGTDSTGACHVVPFGMLLCTKFAAGVPYTLPAQRETYTRAAARAIVADSQDCDACGC
jgi:hypothetical protein